MHTSYSDLEKRMLKHWDAYRIFSRSVEERPEDNQYTFYDGPPFATGLPHYGHIVGSVMKDVIPRFWTMRGKRVARVWGWDCHGLPIENIVEKEFNLGSKKEIQEYGVGAFNDRCEGKVLEYASEWKKVIHRLGRWVDMENAYKTMDLPFMESVWWVFKTLWDKGYIYEGLRPMHICPRCETTLSNFEVALEYADVTDISATVSCEITSGPHRGSYALAWTTTPWTLPGNVLLAVGADIAYVSVSFDGKTYIVAESCVKRVFADKVYEVLGEAFSGSTLAHASYNPIFPHFSHHAGAFRIVTADFVSDVEGTGIVHIAPAYGSDDMALADAEGVKPLVHVEMNGCFVEPLATSLTQDGYSVAGIPVKAKGDYSSVDIQVIKWLAHKGKLFGKEKLVHSYPHCWRCDTPLLNYSTSSWFVRVSSMNEKLLKNNEQTHWVPENIREGRFGKWLEGARDWSISRSRYWGTPLPVWKADDGEVLVIGSVAELEAYVGHKVDNLHKHVVDLLEITKEGKVFRRIPEVLDCWFESGSMPYAQRHYPFEHKELFSDTFPADFIAEGQDQTRGWFYTLHVLAEALFGTPAFKNVIVNGTVLAEDGKKMSKKLKNYPDPVEVIEKYGADAMRYYLMTTPVVTAEHLRFSEKDVDEVAKKFITILRNVIAFYDLHASRERGAYENKPERLHVLDAWIFARLKEVLKEETRAMEAYELDRASRVLQGFVTDISTWYLRRSRERISGKEGSDAQYSALWTMQRVLEIFSRMLAPFMPFFAEMIYQRVQGAEFGECIPNTSVHLALWPTEEEMPDSAEDILGAMGEVRAWVSLALEAREQHGLPIKQALASAHVRTQRVDIHPELLQVFADEINVKSVTIEAGDRAVTLDTVLTPELIREGIAREMTRKINGMRKEAGLTLQDRIILAVVSSHEDVDHVCAEHGAELLNDTLALRIVRELPENPRMQVSLRVHERDMVLAFTVA